MFDHVTIYVPDREASEQFFETVLIPLGIETTYRTNSFAEWDDFSLTHGDEDHPLTTGLHLAFAGPSREHVDAFWKAGVDAGYEDDGPPGPRPSTAPITTAPFLRSPDGNSVEAVHYGDVPATGLRSTTSGCAWPTSPRPRPSTGRGPGARARGRHRGRRAHDGVGPEAALVLAGPRRTTQHVPHGLPGDNAASTDSTLS